jgi:hypothetical protein
MTIDFEEVQGLAADAKELAVFVKHSCMAKAILEKNAHDGGGKSGGRGIGDSFHAGKTAHSAAADKVRVRTLKTSVFAHSVCVKVHYQKWSLDWEVVDKFRGFATVRIGKRTARAGQAHPLYVGVHRRPVKAEAQPMGCVVDVEMPTNGIHVEGNKKNVVHLLGNQLQACIQCAATNWFV